MSAPEQTVSIAQLIGVHPDSDARPSIIIVVGRARRRSHLVVTIGDSDASVTATFVDPVKNDGHGQAALSSETEWVYGEEAHVWVAEAHVDEHPDLQHLRWGRQLDPVRVEVVDVERRSAVAKRIFRRIELKTGFDVGLLFVHGIGEQQTSDTLRQAAGPILEWLSMWFDRAARLNAGGTESEGLLHLIDSGRDGDVFDGSYSARRELADELESEIRTAAAARRRRGGPPPRAEARTIHMLNARAAMTQAHLKIPSGPRSAPAHATLRVEVLEPDGYLKRSSWLLGEAHWADEFTPPSFGSLARWTALAGPVAIAHFFGTRCRRSRRTAIAHLPYLFLVSSLVGLAETLLLVVLVLGLLPVDRLRGLAYKIQRTLTGVLGDAYVFTTDDLQRQAIMDRVSRDLNWMLGRCRAVIVVAHSQGAAVATRVLQRDREGRRADSVLTFGSGLRPLHAVEEGIRSAAVARGGWTALFAVTAVWLGVSLWWFSGSDLGPSLSALGLLLLVWIGSAVGSGIPPETTPPLGPWSGHDDVYSAADPVPGGPLVDEERLKFPGFQSKEIRNGGSVLTDHNLYWRNAEEFVSLVVRRAAEAAHLEPLVRSMDGAENHLAAAAARRRFRVRLLSASRWLAAGSTAACLALGWDALVTVFGWAWSALASTLAGDGWSVRELPARDVFFRFVMPAVPLTLYSGVTGPAWHSWGGSEFRSMTARIGARRSAWSIVFSLATLAGIMPVLWLLWPQGWLAALVSLAATSIAVALAIPRPTLAWRTNGT